MNSKIIKLSLILSIILNVILGIILYTKDSSGTQYNHSELDKEKDSVKIPEDLATLQKKAEEFVKKDVCNILFYPDSYDPVNTTIDSVFYGPLTDLECVKAAQELIDLRSQYSSAHHAYNDAIDHIKFHGMTDLGTNHWGKDRDEAKAKMEDLQAKIERRQSIIQKRDTSMDGKFIGWQVAHRFRAANSEGVVSFGDVLYILNPELTGSYLRYSLEDDDDKNLKSIRTVIESELGIYEDK